MPFDMSPDEAMTIPAPSRTFLGRLLGHDAYECAVGRFNSVMRPGAGGCMRGEAMTPKEEYEIVHLVLSAIEARPQDWRFRDFVVKDEKTGVQLWIANGPDFLRFYECCGQSQTPLRTRSQAHIWNALHKNRHQRESEAARRMKAALMSH